ncbi:DUF3768 domain-containing protein [Sphingobium sp. AN641]|uniref:DUF3768 domain-containing protein n=1 Tax=Sphingobium sp. AN641 TaxID=3133443 RepID=UPI0030C5CD09
MEERIARIRALNDQLRSFRLGGFVTITQGIQGLGKTALQEILMRVAKFDSFEEGNDPYGEHDFGALEYGGQRIFWKIDYYDKSLEGGSPNPADPDVTSRVITIMLASEY